MADQQTEYAPDPAAAAVWLNAYITQPNGEGDAMTTTDDMTPRAWRICLLLADFHDDEPASRHEALARFVDDNLDRNLDEVMVEWHDIPRAVWNATGLDSHPVADCPGEDCPVGGAVTDAATASLLERDACNCRTYPVPHFHPGGIEVQGL